jgi:Domain of unknown function (DUF4282)
VSFLAVLLDTRFEHYATSRLVRVLYIATLTLISLQCFAWFMVGWSLAAGPFLPVAGWLMMIGTPAAWIAELAAVRIVLEHVIVIFRISEDVRKLRDANS